MPHNLRSVACVVATLVIGGPEAGRGTLSDALAAASNLTDLRSPDELTTQFNQDAGKVCLVLLVSPT
jgi:hypothetical protein